MKRMKTFAKLTLVGVSLSVAMPLAASENDLGAENYLEADVNGDGVLAYAEFATFIDLNAEDDLGNAKLVSSRGMHSKAFERIDANGDGIVTPEELQAVN